MITLPIRWAIGADTSFPMPSYETSGSAGVDLRANFSTQLRQSGVTLEPMARDLISTGLHLEIPNGYEAQIRPRSGLALNNGVTLMNPPGTIDSDYRGVLGVLLLNTGRSAFHIAHGDRIAQMIIAPVLKAEFVLSQTLSETDRGTGGFGSTGTS